MTTNKMAKEYPNEIKMYDHVSNSGIVHMPGRRFPAVAIQGDTLSTMFSAAKYFMEKAREYDDEDMYFEALELAERFQGHLSQYEAVLEKEGFEKPYNMDVKGVELEQEFKNS
ncbi:MAG: hypothetical protein OQK04_15865 [Kangiellaceae bacterium]|nr:hypothetical protein [Kangiellaceae bacterium]MCW9000185.1 hypothetical protein [Kangiellaceae bacterium]